jgi:hypothetical protein
MYYLKPKIHIVQIVHKQVILYDSSNLNNRDHCQVWNLLSVPRPCKQHGDFYSPGKN